MESQSSPRAALHLLLLAESSNRPDRVARIVSDLLGGEVLHFVEGELRRAWTRHVQERMLHQVDVKEPFANCFVFQRRRMRLKRAPVFCIGPFLMCEQFVKV